MKNIIKLYSIEIDLRGFLNLVKDSKFEPYRDKITKATNIKTFYLLDENTLFYLDSRNTLKKLKITQNDLKKEMATINIVEGFFLNSVKINNICQITLGDQSLKSIKTNNIHDMREDILLPILIEHFNISKPTFFDNKIIWEKVEDKEIEFLNIFKDKNLSNEDKLEKFSELLEISRSQMSIH